jgi:tetraacyldisaccharide 4'-kinase
MNGHVGLVQQIWERRGFLGRLFWVLLAPVSLLYSCGVRLRNILYHVEWVPTKRLPRPVVSVGNLTVGGTGKTPTTMWLSRELAERGYQVAILSRGYKRTGSNSLLRVTNP